MIYIIIIIIIIIIIFFWCLALEGGESFNVGFLFFLQFKQKINPYVLGILIICQHCFTFKLKKKSIFIPKILPII